MRLCGCFNVVCPGVCVGVGVCDVETLRHKPRPAPERTEASMAGRKLPHALGFAWQRRRAGEITVAAEHDWSRGGDWGHVAMGSGYPWKRLAGGRRRGSIKSRWTATMQRYETGSPWRPKKPCDWGQGSTRACQSGGRSVAGSQRASQQVKRLHSRPAKEGSRQREASQVRCQC